MGAALLPHPFPPRHLTIIDSLAIGIQSFFLALPPNTRRYRPGFSGRVLRFAIPAGAIVAATTLAAYLQARAAGLPPAQQRTAAAIVTLTFSLAVLTRLAMPLTWRRILLVGAALAGFALFPIESVGEFYALALPRSQLPATVLIAALGLAALTVFWALGEGRGAGNAPEPTDGPRGAGWPVPGPDPGPGRAVR